MSAAGGGTRGGNTGQHGEYETRGSMGRHPSRGYSYLPRFVVFCPFGAAGRSGRGEAKYTRPPPPAFTNVITLGRRGRPLQATRSANERDEKKKYCWKSARLCERLAFVHSFIHLCIFLSLFFFCSFPFHTLSFFLFLSHSLVFFYIFSFFFLTFSF